MSELEVEQARRIRGPQAASAVAPAAPGKRNAATEASAGAEQPAIIANARRDLAAVSDSAIPALIAEMQASSADPQAAHLRIEHAKQRIHTMLIAAADRISAAAREPGGESLTKELDTTVATAVALGAFVGYEGLLPHVTKAAHARR